MKQPSGPPIPADVIVQRKTNTMLVMIPDRKSGYMPLTHCYSHEWSILGNLAALGIFIHASTFKHMLKFKKILGNIQMKK